MYQTDDGGSEAQGLNIVGIGATPGGPNAHNGVQKSWNGHSPNAHNGPTPLSPSITEEVSSVSNNASTVNDELYAWLLQNKVDDERIGTYLCSREITLNELALFSDEELHELSKDIEKVNKTTIQMIDRKRFIQACKSLRPRQQQSMSVSHIVSPPSHHGLCISFPIHVFN